MKKIVMLFGFLLMTAGVLADISISETYDVYNLGDRLYIDLDGIRGTENGNLDIDLKCGESRVNLVRIPARAFATDEDQTYSVPYKILDRNDLGLSDLSQIIGTCQISASIGKSVATGESFEVSDVVDVAISLDKSSYNPGEEVIVDIKATKRNGVLLDGYFQGMNASSFSGEIVEGVGKYSFTISETAEAGSYDLKVRTYDMGDSGVLNEGEKSVFYVVNQVPTSLVLSLSDTSVVPGENFSIGVEVFDQAGVEMKGDVFLKIVSPNGEKSENIIKAGEFVLLDLQSNSTVGNWEIVSTFGKLSAEREFEVLPVQKAAFDFEDSVLLVRNIGNVLYNKSIDVNIGGEIKTLQLKVGVGEVRKFALEAPVGSYEVSVGDGESQLTRNVLLTGNAVSISDFKSGAIFRDYSFLWIFLIVVLGGVGLVLVMNHRKTRVVKKSNNFFEKIVRKVRESLEGSRKIRSNVEKKVPNRVMSHIDETLNFTKKSPVVQGLDSKSYSHEDKTMVDFTQKAASGAESALVLKGEKHGSSVVALSIKNFEELGEMAKGTIREVVEKAKGKGLVDYRGGYVFVVFNPLVTKTYKNERLAVKCGVQVLEEISTYNKKFRDKMDIGIGVHSGDLVASKEGSKLKYTSIGNTISFAKRISDVDSGKVVLSDEIKRKLSREIRVGKGKDIGENKTWIVEEMRDTSADKERLRQLLKRQG